MPDSRYAGSRYTAVPLTILELLPRVKEESTSRCFARPTSASTARPSGVRRMVQGLMSPCSAVHGLAAEGVCR